ncbi:hypothetical protein Taro_023479, partial [Colocasia esculenta]|nr:hypothetical protein [Colocasia esculenta]
MKQGSLTPGRSRFIHIMKQGSLMTVLVLAKKARSQTEDECVLKETYEIVIATVAGFFISADKTILEGAKKNSLDKLK